MDNPESVAMVMRELEAKKARRDKLQREDQRNEFGTDQTVAEGERLDIEIAELERKLHNPSETVH